MTRVTERTYHERLTAYRRRLLAELDRELTEVAGYLAAEQDPDWRDGYRERISTLRQERKQLSG